ncbi:hypothetical protein BpHYR1_002369 [Brachionus plicatilis]|uniref:Uncharacterized protein n=1 Tax=Brachionus plicatilis TaxID=10195 RepID=A0A3M7Q882_BRAPC|nr:hypothetical protein BpHYR1_002369 [Brachionus plicatilis]
MINTSEQNKDKNYIVQNFFIYFKNLFKRYEFRPGRNGDLTHFKNLKKSWQNFCMMCKVVSNKNLHSPFIRFSEQHTIKSCVETIFACAIELNETSIAVMECVLVILEFVVVRSFSSY